MLNQIPRDYGVVEDHCLWLAHRHGPKVAWKYLEFVKDEIGAPDDCEGHLAFVHAELYDLEGNRGAVIESRRRAADLLRGKFPFRATVCLLALARDFEELHQGRDAVLTYVEAMEESMGDKDVACWLTDTHSAILAADSELQQLDREEALRLLNLSAAACWKSHALDPDDYPQSLAQCVRELHVHWVRWNNGLR